MVNCYGRQPQTDFFHVAVVGINEGWDVMVIWRFCSRESVCGNVELGSIFTGGAGLRKVTLSFGYFFFHRAIGLLFTLVAVHFSKWTCFCFHSIELGFQFVKFLILVVGFHFMSCETYSFRNNIFFREIQLVCRVKIPSWSFGYKPWSNKLSYVMVRLSHANMQHFIFLFLVLLLFVVVLHQYNMKGH